MNDGLLKLERQCKRRMRRLAGVSLFGSAKDKRKASEVWTNREQAPGGLYKPGPAMPCTVYRP